MKSNIKETTIISAFLDEKISNILSSPIQFLMTAHIKSPVKSKIILIILKNSPISISEIQRKLKEQGDKYNYRTVWQHIQRIESDGTIISKKFEHEAGKPVKIYPSEYFNENKKEFEDFLSIATCPKKYEKFKKESEQKKKIYLKQNE